MANNKQVKIGIGFDVDKNGLKELENIQNQLINIASWGNQAKGTDEFTKGLKEAGQTASKLYDILEKSYSANLGTVNVTKFKQELDKAGISVKTMKQDLAKAGAQGNAAFASLGSALLNTNVQLKKSNSLLDEMATTMANTVKWGVTSSIFNNISSSVQDAYHYVKQLDSSLNDIRIVTDKSAESMAKFAVQANTAAKNLGASTRDYTDASLIYYQQGLSDKEVAARAETTLKTANVTGQNTAEVSEQLTAVWNGYKVSAEEAELYIDKLAAVAATTASDLEELSTGMSKVASAANLMGIDIDQLNAQLATIVSVTRQAPESVGTALKTIYARMGDIEAGVDTETTLGNYTKEMETMGFNVLDANGNLRDMGAVIEEIGAKWTTLSREQQIALSQTMAGTRQYNNLLSLFDNWDMYTEAMNTSADAAGTLQKQQDTYMESTAAHLQKLKTTAEDLYDTLIKPEEVNALLDTFTNGIDVLGTFFDTFGGGVKSMAAGVVILSSVFGKQIGEGLINFQKNKYQEQSNLDVINTKKELVQKKIDRTGNETIEERAAIAKYETEAKYAKEILKLKNGITNEDYEQMTSIQAKIGALTEEVELHKKIAEEKKKEFQKKYDNEELNFDDIDDKVNSLIENLEIEKERLQELQQNDDVPSSVIKEQKQEIKNLQEKVSLLQQIREENNAAQSAERQRSAQETDFAVMQQNAEKAAALNNGITLVTSSLSVLATTWGAFQSLGSIWADEDLTFGEKLAQTFGLLITSGGLLINSVGQIKDAYSGLTNIFKDASDAQAVQVKILEMLGVAQTNEATTTMGQAAANEIENATEEHTQQENVKSTATEVAQTIAENQEAGATMNQVKANLTKIGTGTKDAGKILLLTKVPGLLTKVWSILSKFAGPLAAITLSLQAINIWANNFKKWREEDAKAAELQAKAQEEVIQKTTEEYNAKQDVINAYKDLNEQYENGELATSELRRQVVDLLQQHGYEKEAVDAKTASYTELLKILRDIEELGPNVGDVVRENEEGVLAKQREIKSTMWKDLVEEGSAGDSFFGLEDTKSIDVGTITGLDDLYDILDEYEIEFDVSGHINLDSLVEKLTTDGNSLITALENSTSESSKKLLDAITPYQEAIDKAQEYQDTATQAKAEGIEKRVYGKYEEEGLQNVEQYNQAVGELADGYMLSGVTETYNEAIQKAREYLSLQDELAQKMYGWESMAGTTELNFADSVEQNILSSLEGFDKLSKESGRSFQEMADSASGIEFFMQQWLSEDEIATITKGFEQWKNALGEAGEELTLEDFYNQINRENPLEGTWLADETTIAKTQEVFQAALDSGKEELLNYFDEEDWDTILALGTAEERVAKAAEIMQYHLDKLKTDFGSTLAPELNTAALSLTEQQNYINSDNVENVKGYSDLIKQAEIIKAVIPDLTDEMTTLTDKSKAGTEEWNRALQEVQQTMAAMAEDPTNDGVFSKEDAQNLNITESGLKEELLAGNIDTDTYDQKFAGAIDYEMELQGLNAEEVRDYADSLQDVAKSSDEVANGLAEDEQAALKVAKANSRMNKGIETLAKNFDDIRDKIEDNEEGSQEWAEGLKELRGGMGDLLNIDGDALSQEFLTSTENLNLMKEASQGSAEAIEQLRAKAAIDIVQNTEVFLNGDEETRARLNQLNAEITNFSAENDLEIGAHVDDSQFIAACNEMIAASGMTAEQVGNYFKAMGYDANVKTVEQPTTSKIPVVSYQVEGDLENGMSMIPDVTMQDVQTTVNVPVVESLTYTGSAGGTVNSSAKKGSGGGGGGGGAKPKTASREKQKFKPNLDPFHEVNEQLDLMAQKLERLSKKQEKAFGKDLIKNLQEQNKVLESQNEKLKEKIKITDQEIAKDKNKLKNFKINGKKLSKIEKVKYNEDGSVANYDEVLSAAAADVEKLRKKYDNEAKKKYKEGSKKDEARKKLKDKLDEAKEEYSNLEELLNEHDEYIINKEELLNQQQDNIDQMVQNNIEIFTIPIEIKLEVSDIKENYNNFLEEWNKITSEKPIQLEIDTIKDNANLAIGNIEHLTTMVTQTQAELAKIQKGESSDLFGKDEQAAYETLKEYTTKLQDELSKIPQYYEDAAAAVANAMDAVSDAMAEKISDMEFYSDSIQHMINVNEKLYGENKAAGKNKDYYKNLVAQSNALVTTLKGNADYWKSEMDSITDKNSEAYKIAKENYISATQDMQAALETTLENIQLQLEQNIKGLFIAFEEGLSPDNWNVDTMTSDWEMAVEESERYLNNIDKANQLKQLELKYQQAIDKSSSLSTQKELLALKQEELNVLKEQGKLTQYDIDRANKKLQLKLAEMALEEAQNNKSKMRLRRDSQGNYSYQYVADQDNIAEKQAAVDNLKAEMANDDFKHMKDVVSQYLGDESDFSERYAELAANGATDAELKEFQESYISRLVDQGGEFSKAWQYLTESTAAATGKDLSSMSEEEKLQMLKDNYGADIISSQALVFLNNLTGNLKTTEEATKYLNEALFTKIDAERTEAEEAKNRASAAAGYGENFEAMSTALNSINAEVTAFNTESDKTITNLKTQLDGVQSVFDIIKTFLNDEKVKAGLETLKSAIGTDTDANGNQVTSDGSLTAASSDEQSGAVGDTSGTTNINETETGPDAKDSETTKQSNGKIDIGDVVTIKKEANTYTKKSKKNEFYTTKDSKKKVVKAKKDETYVVQAKPVEGKDGNNKTATFIKLGNKKWVKQGSIKGFDTGGYTGDWKSSEGRLAFLHQKELVLNAKDTENMLKMLDVSRSMTAVMNSVSDKVRNIISQVDKINSINNLKAHTEQQKQEIEQRVHIEATFPNVSQSREIEDAFNNLINIAAQRAYNTKRLK